MKAYLDCWISVAQALLPQALTGEPQLVEADQTGNRSSTYVGFVARISGDVEGGFVVMLEPLIFESPFFGDGVEQKDAWREFLREVAEAAAGELLASAGIRCRVESLEIGEVENPASRAFRLETGSKSWSVKILDELRPSLKQRDSATGSQEKTRDAQEPSRELSAGVELLLGVELEATLRFGSCEMPLGEIVELGPGDVVELDRHISDPVDLIVGDKIVARGDVVLVNGNFGLRVQEVATPQKRLESIRCLF